MDVIKRNFLRLLREGTFGDDEPLEPMSPWKWGRLYQAALLHGVAPLVFDGAERRRGEFAMQMPGELMAEWRATVGEVERGNRLRNAATAQLVQALRKRQCRPMLMRGQALARHYPDPLRRTSSNIDLYFPFDEHARQAEQWAEHTDKEADADGEGTLRYTFEGAAVAHHEQMERLTSKRLNRRLQAIISEETRCCDSEYATIDGVKVETAPPTLQLLLLMAQITRQLLNDGVRLKQVVDLGMLLRDAGQDVDFAKLQAWLRRIGMHQMARVQAAMLADIFRFDADELQFSGGKADKTIGDIADEIAAIRQTHWQFVQGERVFVRNTNSNAMLWHVRHSAKYFRFYPQETFANFFANFAASLSHIEE